MTENMPEDQGAPMDIQATGRLEEGVLTITVEKDGVSLSATVDSATSEDRWDTLEVLHAAFPEAVFRVSEHIAQQVKADRGE